MSIFKKLFGCERDLRSYGGFYAGAGPTDYERAYYLKYNKYPEEGQSKDGAILNQLKLEKEKKDSFEYKLAQHNKELDKLKR